MLDLTLRELKIVQLQLQSSNVIHYCLNYHMHHQHCLSWGQKRVPTSGSFTTGASSILSYSMSSKDIHSIHLLHLQNTKAAIRIWQQFVVVLLVSDVLHIQCVVAFSIVVNMLSRPAVHRHHFDRTKIHPANWTHPIFQIDLNNLIECIMWNS